MHSIVLCEPQCISFEHVSFNAALLVTVRLAYPEAALTFMGEADHVSRVQSEMYAYLPANQHLPVEFVPIPLPAHGIPQWRRLFGESSWCKRLFKLANERGAKLVVLCSIAPTGLIALKLSMKRPTGFRVLAVPHATLNSLLERCRLLVNRPLTLASAFALPHHGRVRYVALGPSIAAKLHQYKPELASRFYTLDHPCLWSDAKSEQVEGRISFGYLGSPRKGLERYVEMVSTIVDPGRRGRFVQIGYVEDKELIAKYSGIVEGLSTTPIPKDEYFKQLRALSYVVGTATPSQFQLRASGTFFDALAFTKPAIYLRNPYVEAYFEQMGDVGYLCDSMTEMAELIGTIIARFPRERYEAQCANILRTRTRFSPEYLADRFRIIAHDLCAEQPA